MTKRRRILGALAVATTLVAAMGTTGGAQVDPQSGSVQPTPAGVVLWNRLGSWWQVRNSGVGPNGYITGGSFVPGKFGNAFRAEHYQDFRVKFWPGYLLNRTEGTVEFWGRVSGFSASIEGGGGYQPDFVEFADDRTGASYGITLTANDGAGGGGLSGWAGTGANRTASGSFGDWTYEEVLGPDVEGWNHYAIVWKEGGIPGVDDGTRRLAVFLDGVLESGYWVDPGGAFPYIGGSFPVKLGSINRVEQGAVEIDNLIVWNCAVTDFSGRVVEKPGFRVCAR